jgi:hypothetical protein
LPGAVALKSEGAPAAEIACVNNNFKATSEEQMAERVLEGAPAAQVESESEAETARPTREGLLLGARR